MKNFYLTTAIDYANGAPHLGHAYEKTLADIVARHHRLRGKSVHYLTGLDEHGQKVQQSAQREGVEPIQFCDGVAEQFIRMCDVLCLSNDDYIRTTQERHKLTVRGLLQAMFDKGEIYRADYNGYYSTRQEQFLQEKDKVDGEWPEIFGEVVEITEPNYFFRLSKYQDWLIDYIRQNDSFIIPRFRQKQVLEFLKEPLNDLCISRPKERLSWGIPLSFDEDFVTYVWFDALVNYLSAVGYGHDEQLFEKNWPADFHVIGKDILVPPHAIYWPIMLHAAGIELPKSFLVHGWWNVSGKKMSKTLGNIVDPFELVKIFGANSVRYFFAREMTVGQDSDFSTEQLLTRYNNDLGNDLGNLVSRLLNMGGRYCESKIPVPKIDEEPEQELRRLWEDTNGTVINYYDELQIHRGLEDTFTFIRAINRYAELRAPWKLAKSAEPGDRDLLETSIFYMAEALRLACVLLSSVMPGVVEQIHRLVGENMPLTYQGNLEWGERLVDNVMGEKTILFPRIEQ